MAKTIQVRGADCDAAIREAIAHRKSGADFLTAEQSLANMRAAMKAGANADCGKDK